MTGTTVCSQRMLGAVRVLVGCVFAAFVANRNRGIVATSTSGAALLLSWLAAAPLTLRADPPADQLEFFEARVRPVLVEYCYECHNSVDTSEGDVVLDFRDGIRQVINLDHPDESRLLRAVRHEIEGAEMPSGGGKLPPKVISDLRRWIAMGAPDPRRERPTPAQLQEEQSWEATLKRRKTWWALQPIRRPEIPAGQGQSWSDHPIDRFVLKQLEVHGLRPAPPATKEVLLRRLKLALLGLPPTPEELAAFVRDDSPEAYEEWVDRWLASPAFGERWARHWMDWVRFAESHGSEGDPAVPYAYRYRDYLIRAWNRDIPYRQLLLEHVAGDLLKTPRANPELGINESILGTAHWRMVFHGFAPTDALDEKVRFTDDQINAFSKAFLGLTVSCARCHNHKFDAISQADYYALFGILGSTHPTVHDANLPERQDRHRAELQGLKGQIREAVSREWLERLSAPAGLVNELRDHSVDAKDERHVLYPLHVLGKAADEPSRRAAWKLLGDRVRQYRRARADWWSADALARWNLADPNEASSWYFYGNGLRQTPVPAGEFALQLRGDSAIASILPGGVYTHLLSTKHRGIGWSPRRRLNGKYELWVQVAGDGDAFLRYVVQDYPRNGTVYPVPTIRGGQWRWQRLNLEYWEGDQIHVELTTAADAPLLARNQPRSWWGVREVAIVPRGIKTQPPRELPWLPVWESLRDADIASTSMADFSRAYVDAIRTCVAKWKAGQLSDAEALFLDACLQAGLLPNRRTELSRVGPLLDRYLELEGEIPEPTRVVGLGEADSHDQPLFVRGNHKKPGKRVPRRFLEALGGKPYQTSQSGRLQLAHDLVREDNPLVARVIVNRLWHHLFGQGIVATPDNFGRLGALPTHPELLDWLADELMRREWSLKQMIRLMVTSETWKQSSVPSALAKRTDPANHWLSHFNVNRMDAESIRDAMLFVSGRLDAKPYGPSVGGNTPRRSVYVRVQRNALDPFLRVFDFPEPFSAVGRRSVTTVPAQSLTMMNDPFVLGLARSWAERVLTRRLGSDEERIEQLYTEAFGRLPTAHETEAALRLLSDTRNSAVAASRLARRLEQERAEQRSVIAALREQAGAKLRREFERKAPPPPTVEPIAAWDFTKSLSDTVGSADCELRGGAQRTEFGLKVGPGAFAISKPLAQDVTAKTLAAWVQLDSLDQRGGGVVSLQTSDGSVFDAVVFGERQPRQWMAGSNFFQRTKDFGGEPETTAADHPVHIALVYHTDGRIEAFRNGRSYGKPYASQGPVTFHSGRSLMTFGLRHLPPGGNKFLAATVVRASLFDQALSADDVASLAGTVPQLLSKQRLWSVLDERQKRRWQAAERKAAMLDKELDRLTPLPSADDVSVWTTLTHALLNVQEFIYVR